MKWLTRISRWFFGPPLEKTVFAHWVPPHNSIQAWSVGDGRCYYCHAREDAEEFSEPCPRKRPVELA